MFQKILVAIDKFAVEEGVLQAAISLAQLTQAKLLLLHVLTPSNEGYPSPMFLRPDNIYPQLYEAAWKSYALQMETFNQQEMEWLRSLAEQTKAVGIEVETSRVQGDPGQTLCEVARSWGADLIMVGRRGYSGLNELLVGSVSNYVLHHAPCAVLALQHQTPQPLHQSEALSAGDSPSTGL
ncbi:hypothetical protein BST81_14975 [Leptolyngbya sp. 'hensonii']|uniref:universal stress protein n=1 Tax=Leptolyngbya sp. 'hensonii' TaxID=1922337 RepID=UPI00094FB317|nr:universal stress protein [Leptolyngbya sp. 'hensonii']OLP17625.1 hypothetical protein BST81_14975 [Leptolyngbya sp. 'hensonii']